MEILEKVIDNLKDYVDDIYQGPTVEYMVYKNRDCFKDDCYSKWAAEECVNYICNRVWLFTKDDVSTISNIKKSLNDEFNSFMFEMLDGYYKTNKHMFYVAYVVGKDLQFVTMDFFNSYI